MSFTDSILPLQNLRNYKSRIRLIQFSLASLFMLTLPLNAVETDTDTEKSSEVLTWEQAQNEALVNNPQILAARSKILESQEAARASEAHNLPQVYLNSKLTRTFVATPGNHFSTDIEIREKIYDGGKTATLTEQREQDISAARARLDQEMEEILLNLRNSFIEVFFAEELAKLQETVISRRQENTRLVNLRFEGGRENRGAVLRGQAMLLQARNELKSTINEIEISRHRLALALGRSKAVAEKIVMTPEELRIKTPTGVEAPTRISPGEKFAAAQINSARAAVDFERAGRKPDISAGVSLSRNYAELDASQGKNQVAASISLSLPIYQGGEDQAKIAAGVARAASAQAELTNAEGQILLARVESLLKFKNAASKIEIDAEILKSTQLQTEIARRQYQLGLINFQDWDNLERQLGDAERSLIISRRETLIAQAKWLKTHGQALVEKRSEN